MRQMKERLISVVDVILVEEADMNYCHPFNMPLLEDNRQSFSGDQFYSSLARQLTTNALLFYYSKTRKEEMVR